LSDALPSVRVIAQEVLGADAPIDFVAVEPQGRAITVLVGLPGQDLELIGLALAQRSWLAQRLGDWLQIAPDLGARPEAGVTACVICPSFGGPALAAAQALGTDVIRLVRYHTVRDASGVGVLLEGTPRQAESNAHEHAPHPARPSPEPSEASWPLDAPPQEQFAEPRASASPTRGESLAPEAHAGDVTSTPAFRTGLSDDDLGLTSQERGEFE
jgi:hypothetical protein